MPDSLVFFGGEVKALDDSGRVGGYAVRHKDEAHKDFVGDFFDAETYLGAREGDGCDTLFHHGKPVKKGLEKFADHLFAPMKTKRDDVGLFAETVLNLADDYEKTVFNLIKAGKISFSSGAPGHMVKRDTNGHLKRWPVAEISFTPTPCDFENKVYDLKALDSLKYVALIESEPDPAPVKNVFEEELAERKLGVWQLQSAFETSMRKLATVAAASSVTGVTVDVEAKVNEAVASLGQRLAAACIEQINEYVESPNQEHFYLKQLSIPESLVSEGLDSHSQAVVSAVEGFAHFAGPLSSEIKRWQERVRDKQEFRAADPVKAGRTISATNRDRLAAVMAKLDELAPIFKEMRGALAELHEMAEPKKSFADEEVVGGFLAEFDLLRHRIDAARR